MKNIVKVVSVLLCLMMVFAFTVGCNRNDDFNQKVDKTKTQLYVKYYNGGFGDEWLNKLCAEFEAMYADAHWEEGKTGVQIMKEFTRGQLSGPNDMKGKLNNVYLMENIDYYTFVASGMLLDLTDTIKDYAVTGAETKETDRKIIDKIPQAYDEFLNVSERYYGLPLFETSINLNYDIDMFNARGLYFAKGQTAEDFTEEDFADEDKVASLFVDEIDDARSDGPDGKPETTSDNGLPATYKDFRALTIYMKVTGVTPFVWNGYETGYLTGLINDMWANNEGAAQMKLNFTFKGDANTLVEMDSNGKILRNADNSVKLMQETRIGENNKNLLQLQKGKLDAIEFAKLLLDDGLGNKNSANYYSKSFDSSFSNINAQNYFLNPDENDIDPIGFLVDGGWWYNEAKVPSDRNIGILPLPKTDADRIGDPNTKVSDRASFIFVNNETPAAVQPVAKAFVSFLQSDYAMETYTKYTNTFRAMKYDLSEETIKNLSAYGKSVYDTRNSVDTVVLPWTPISETARKSASLLSYRTYGFSVNTQENNPVVYFKDHGDATAESYFEAIWKYRK